MVLQRTPTLKQDTGAGTGRNGDSPLGSVPQPWRYGQARAWRKWLLRLGMPVLVLLTITWLRWQAQRPREVTLIQPTSTPITETIASSGRVGGVVETAVGAQASGIVDRLFVAEGARVRAGEPLAVLKHDLARAQVAQAEQAVNTAQAQLAQVERGPLRSEVEAAAEQVRQAQAQLAQQRATVVQTQQSVAQARAQLQQLQAERALAAAQLGRQQGLFDRGYAARAEYDQAATQMQVAEKRVVAAQQAVQMAQANVQAAQAGAQAAQANIKALAAHLHTVQTGATPEEVAVARQRVTEATYALRVARQQAENATVTAPFAGIVTAIIAEAGQLVDTKGVVRLVSTALEIRLDVDESNLADLALGQEAVITSSTFIGEALHGSVSEIGAAVDVTRGTVTVTVTPRQSPVWLRPGQTVNVNIITNSAIPRLLVPASAINRANDHTVVLVVEHGRALEKTVVTRPPTTQGVPVLAGLRAEDRIIADIRGIAAGARVRIRRTAGEGGP